MRSTTFFREVARNITSGTARLGLFLSVSFVGLGLLVLSDVLTIAGMVKQGVAYQASGAAITTVTLPGRIDGTACENLTRAPGVLAAGAIREAGDIQLAVLPDAPLAHYMTTPSFARVLDTTDEGRGSYVSEEVAVAVAPGGLAVHGRTVPVRGTFPYPADGRRAGFGWAMLSPTIPAGDVFDECWVKVWPERSDTRRMLLTTVAPAHESADQDPQVSQLNTTLGARFSGVSDYADRPTRFASGVALVIGVFVAWMAVRIRRVEIAANLHAGAARRQLVLQQALEVAAWSIPAAILVCALGSAAAGIGASTELPALGLRCAHIVTAFFAGTMAGASAGALLVREERLWGYVRGG